MNLIRAYKVSYHSNEEVPTTYAYKRVQFPIWINLSKISKVEILDPKYPLAPGTTGTLFKVWGIVEFPIEIFCEELEFLKEI